MKSTKFNAPSEPKIKFPCLLESNKTGTVLLVTGESGNMYIGTELYEGKGGYASKDLGLHSSSWDKSHLELYKGSLTLEND